MVAVAFPIAGYVGWGLGGRVDTVDASLVGGALTGAGIGAVQWWAADGAFGRPGAWVAASAVGFAAGLAVGAALVGYDTDLGSLALMGVVTGAALGAAQGLVLAGDGTRRGLAVPWGLAMPVLFGLGWSRLDRYRRRRRRPVHGVRRRGVDPVHAAQRPPPRAVRLRTKAGAVMNSERYDVVVIGGGQAGLAIGHELDGQGVRFTILEAGATPAAAWASRWDSLKLFTSARYDSLPGREFPGEPDHYPTRDEVVSYLTDYARHFALPVELDSRVSGLQTDGRGYLVDLAGRTLSADQVVVATGPFQTPRLPMIAGQLAGDVTQIHSADYRAPAVLPVGRVLVVGGGNTGFQIAEELAERARSAPRRRLASDAAASADPRPRPVLVAGATRRHATSRSVRLGRRMKDRDTLIGSSPRSRAQDTA